MSPKELEYMDYIEEHISNVKKAYVLIHDDLYSRFNLNPREMDRRIDTHDSSKYTSLEFTGYRQYFYPDKGEYKDQGLFDCAWKQHYTVNDHHPEHWKTHDLLVEMHDAAVAEMFCDWLAMSMKFHTVPSEWYYKEISKPGKLEFHEKTKAKVESNLDILDKGYRRFLEEEKAK